MMSLGVTCNSETGSQISSRELYRLRVACRVILDITDPQYPIILSCALLNAVFGFVTPFLLSSNVEIPVYFLTIFSLRIDEK